MTRRRRFAMRLTAYGNSTTDVARSSYRARGNPSRRGFRIGRRLRSHSPKAYPNAGDPTARPIPAARSSSGAHSRLIPSGRNPRPFIPEARRLTPHPRRGPLGQSQRREHAKIEQKKDRQESRQGREARGQEGRSENGQGAIMGDCEPDYSATPEYGAVGRLAQAKQILRATNPTRVTQPPLDYSKLESMRAVTNAIASGVTLSDLPSALAALEAHTNGDGGSAG